MGGLRIAYRRALYWSRMGYECLIWQADQIPFEGWDFGVFRGRFVETEPSWEFSKLLRNRMRHSSSMLDLGTGGGEFLSSLAPLPPQTVATEAYEPNVPIARRRLAPLGVRVFDTTESSDEALPFTDGTFDLVVSRHESYAPSEVRRVLVSGGTFVTQQVGGRDLEELNHALGAPPHTYRLWNLAAATDELERAGFEVLDGREELLPGTFYDIGAVVLYLRIIPWQIPGFDLADYDQTLRSLHAMMESGTPLKVNGHRFLVIARSTSDVMAGKQEKECR
jgi:SAM-dependent methyltransferase